MKYSINREHLKKVAEEMGMKIEFDSTNPGISFLNENKHMSWTEVKEEIFELLDITEHEK